MEWVTERYKLVYNAETKRAVSRWGIWTDRKREWEEEKGGGRGRLATELEGSKKKRGRRGRKRAAHNGLILTFLWGPVLPVSFQMNGNCPAGFNHVLNWEREKKDEEEKEKKKKGGKCFYGDWESIALGVDLLLLRFIPHHTSTHRDANTQTYFELLAL